MPEYPLKFPESFRFLNGGQDVVKDNIVEARDSRGQIQARDLGGGRWTGSFNLVPMSPNGEMYEAWRYFTSLLRQGFGTFKMPPFDILTGQLYKMTPCRCFISPAAVGERGLGLFDSNLSVNGMSRLSNLRWFTHDDNLYEFIGLVEVNIGSAHNPNLATRIEINPPLITPLARGFRNIYEEDTYCIARATTITLPSIASNGMYRGAGIQWTQVIQK